MTWIYENTPYTTTPDEYQGFVYCITNTSNGMKYIGKKNFWTIRKLKPLKGKTNRRHRREATDWMAYCGSSAALTEDLSASPNPPVREILYLCANKTEMAYWETLLQFKLGVLFDPNYYNEFISCRINTQGVKHIQHPR